MKETDLRLFIQDLIKKAGSEADPSDVIDFLEDNSWFDYKPDFSRGKVMLIDEQMDLYEPPIMRFLTDGIDLFSSLKNKFPDTANKLDEFLEETGLDQNDESVHFLMDLLMYHLRKELAECSNTDVQILVQHATVELSQERAALFIRYLDWYRSFYKTAYTQSFRLKKRAVNDASNEAYDAREYLTLLYYLYNDGYIRRNEMYYKAAKSKNYVDTWLFMALHFICSIRFTDLQRMYHPILPKPAEIVLYEIASGTFSDADAIRTLRSVLQRFDLLSLTPNKTKRYSGIEDIRFDVPTSCEVHIGKLLACAEAHSILSGTQDQPLIRKISTYQEITRYMGKEIGNLFIERNFSARAANKSYLQSIYKLSDEILDESSGIKGYILSSHARSHKGNLDSFISEVTATYLKDGKFTGMTLENIAFQYIERGVLSSIVSYLFKMMPSVNFEKMTPEEQTALHKELKITPLEAERTVSVVARSRETAHKIAADLITKNNTDNIMKALERIVNGEAFSKSGYTFCLKTALGECCIDQAKRNCLGCRFEILTKATLFYMVNEFKRMRDLYNCCDSPIEQKKWKQIATEKVLPRINEMMICLKEYPDEVYNAYKEIITEELND